MNTYKTVSFFLQSKPIFDHYSLLIYLFFYKPEIVLTILQTIGKNLFVICTKLINQERTAIKFWLNFKKERNYLVFIWL